MSEMKGSFGAGPGILSVNADVSGARADAGRGGSAGNVIEGAKSAGMKPGVRTIGIGC